MKIIRIPAYYYQQFDADFDLDVPAEGFGGWKKADLEINLGNTAIVIMHVWNCGTRKQYPGWYRAVEYIPRANEICRNVFPRLLEAVRASGLKLFHVAVPGEYLGKYLGYAASMKLTDEEGGKEETKPEQVEADPVLRNMRQFKADHAVPGIHNKRDIELGFKNLDFPKEVKPQDHEEIAVDSEQLFTLCKKHGINHLVYTGFAINGCLLVSPGGIMDMSRRGIMCSAIRQAVTAIENRETAENETGKELGLWFVSIISGFIYDIDDFIAGTKECKIT